MYKRKKLNSKNCTGCQFLTNSSIEHDDAFSGDPWPISWWCCNPDRAGFEVERIKNVRPKSCPIPN